MNRRQLLQAAAIPLVRTIAARAQAPQRDYDESKVRHYTLPDPLLLSNGQRVASASVWEKQRRPELLRLFETNVYGRAPAGPPPGMRYEVISTQQGALGGKAERKLVTGYFTGQKSGPALDILIYLPANRTAAAPLFASLNFRGNHTVNADPGIPITTKWVYNQGRAQTDNRAKETGRGMQAGQWQVERLLARGYGLATIYAGDLSPDFDKGFALGIEPLFYRPGQTKRDPDEWGAIAAWTWGLSRLMDYLVTDPAIDPRRIAVMGHSRMGKTALWAGARDSRFAMVISNCSGAGGATLARRHFGESVKDLNTNFPWWYCENYRKFADDEDALPVDQHEVLALSAPRPLYIAVAQDDLGSDPRGQFLSAVAASPVYRLLGTDGFGATEMPPLHTPVMSTIGFHIRAGRHDVTTYDWDQYMNFADRYMTAPARSAGGGEWIVMFNGRNLDGWKADLHPEAWTVEDGAIVGNGPKCNLFWMQGEFADFDFQAEANISDGGNSGMFFRKGFGPRGAKGYEAQINSTHEDPKKTGSLYNFQNVYEQLVPPETWFTQEVIARGNHIVIKVNGKVTADYVDEKNTFSKGYLALQQHHQGSIVKFRNLRMRPLP
jgi:hypothetical protein